MIILFYLDEGNVIWRVKPERVVSGERDRPRVLGKVVEAGGLRAMAFSALLWHWGEMLSDTKSPEVFSRQTREIFF